ncbi:MAG: N-acetyltransferase [Chloroflexota bacterium]|nr:MAG: N-acetyltransferase [Chloroflexota bacterium]
MDDVPDRGRYEARLAGALAGFLEYRMVGTRRILLHTEVDDAFAGRGVGTALARYSLEAARMTGTRVTVRCPFIRAWLARHPEYEASVTTEPGRQRRNVRATAERPPNDR